MLHQTWDLPSAPAANHKPQNQKRPGQKTCSPVERHRAQLRRASCATTPAPAAERRGPAAGLRGQRGRTDLAGQRLPASQQAPEATGPGTQRGVQIQTSNHTISATGPDPATPARCQPRISHGTTRSAAARCAQPAGRPAAAADFLVAAGPCPPRSAGHCRPSNPRTPLEAEGSAAPAYHRLGCPPPACARRPQQRWTPAAGAAGTRRDTERRRIRPLPPAGRQLLSCAGKKRTPAGTSPRRRTALCRCLGSPRPWLSHQHIPRPSPPLRAPHGTAPPAPAPPGVRCRSTPGPLRCRTNTAPPRPAQAPWQGTAANAPQFGETGGSSGLHISCPPTCDRTLPYVEAGVSIKSERG
mmetsp:Transcript_99163/g.265173  ORF Transcript_99163/g.265173 Transcript_99163/m.265173 type:complete len:355 (+) Transcript_99163:495-1559(+)